MLANQKVDRNQRSEALQFVIFALGDSPDSIQMAVNVQKVKELIEIEKISPLPAGSSPLTGILDLRGTPVPILDVQSFLKVEQPFHDDSKQRLMICELEGLWIAFRVGKVSRIYNCHSADFLPPPTEQGMFITGMFRRQDGFVSVLDLDMILSQVTGAKTVEKAFARKDRFKGKRILIVDDSKVMLKRLEKIFQVLGFQYHLASDGKEALKILRSAEGQVDLIFTDIEMPVLDGISMAREIRRDPKLSSIPLLFNSALSNPALIRDIRAEHLGEYIVKFDEDLILSQLELMLG